MPLLLLIACFHPPAQERECAPWQDLQITDPDGLASENDLTRIHSVFDELSASSDQRGLCVPEVRVVADGSCEDGGDDCYQGQGEPIFIADSSVSDVRVVACEALADQLDPVGTDPQHFGSTSSFIDACSAFPATLSLEARAGSACSWELAHSPTKAQATLDLVFPRWPQMPGEPVDLNLFRHSVEGLEDDLGAMIFAGGDGWSWEGDEDIVRVDMDSFQVTGRVALPPEEGSVTRRLLPADGGPILVYAGEQTLAWQLDPTSLEWATIPFPSLAPTERFYGVTGDHHAWIAATSEETGLMELWEVDLETGERAVVAAPSWWEIENLAGDGERLVGKVAAGPLDERIFEFDPRSGDSSSAPIPYDWHLQTPGPLTDDLGGSWVVGAWGTQGLNSLAAYDGDRWHLAADPCGAARLRGVPWAAFDGERLWFWESDHDAPGGAWLTEVRLDL